MPRRTWEATTNAMIVMEGLKGKPVAERCTAQQLSQAPDDQGREHFLSHAPKAFEVHEPSQREARLAREHARVTTLVGELTLERNTSDEALGCAGRPRSASPTGMQTCARGCGR